MSAESTDFGGVTTAEFPAVVQDAENTVSEPTGIGGVITEGIPIAVHFADARVSWSSRTGAGDVDLVVRRMRPKNLLNLPLFGSASKELCGESFWRDG